MISSAKVEKIRNFYLKHQNDLYAFALSIVRDSGDAEDAVQTAFEKILNRIHSNGFFPKNLTVFIYKVVQNAALDRLRRRKDMVSIDEYILFAPETDFTDGLSGYGLLNSGFQKLDTIDQRIVMMRVYSELSFREISGVVELPLFTVSTRYYRAIASLKKELESRV